MRWYPTGSGGGRQDHRILELYFLCFLLIRIEEEGIQQRWWTCPRITIWLRVYFAYFAMDREVAKSCPFNSDLMHHMVQGAGDHNHAPDNWICTRKARLVAYQMAGWAKPGQLGPRNGRPGKNARNPSGKHATKQGLRPICNRTKLGTDASSTFFGFSKKRKRSSFTFQSNNPHVQPPNPSSLAPVSQIG
jgi:hypothetical protein